MNYDIDLIKDEKVIQIARRIWAHKALYILFDSSLKIYQTESEIGSYTIKSYEDVTQEMLEKISIILKFLAATDVEIQTYALDD